METLVLTQASDPMRADDMPPGVRIVRPIVLRRPHSIIPGFGLTLGLTLAWLGLIVMLPLVALFARAAALDASRFIETVTSDRVVAALRLSFGASLAAGLANAAFGAVLAWVLVRYRFFGRRLVDALVDVPFALPTAVAGIALAALYAKNGWVGGSVNWLLGLVGLPGIKIAFSPLGIVIALVFIGVPFVVRTVQPIMEEIDREVEVAAATLGASRFQSIYRVILPSLFPAILTGFALAFARAAGEYGSVIFIAGNIPYVSEIAPLLIIIKLEEFNYAGATAIGTVMLAVAFIMLFVINLIQAWTRRYANVA